MKGKVIYEKKVLDGNFIGYNEYSREECISAFLNNQDDICDLKNHKLGIEILYSATKTLYDKKYHKQQIEKIKIPKNKRNDKKCN